ncbi:uncharacterized protein LOC130724001 [Lotus japonicus]|uniref:uncharacterized protein LOC130724001 n=1 Tax=Lotus japonicus TaxID=34305 RepID=UPI002584AD00|nr:uncharacterized protein LOC130724001 [Lotus japonicus]
MGNGPLHNLYKICFCLMVEAMFAGMGGCGPCLQRFSDDVLFPESVSAGSCEDGGVLRVSDDVLFPEMASKSGLDASAPLVVVVASASDDGGSQLVENEEAGWARAHSFQFLANNDNLLAFNLVLSGFCYAAFHVKSTSVFADDGLLATREGAREGNDDPISSAFDVGSLSFDGFGSFRPTLSRFEVGACFVSGGDLVRGVIICSDAYSISVREEVAYEAGDVDFVDDPALDFSPPRTRPRGRPKKTKEAKITLGSSRRSRGRPRKYERLTIDIAPAPPSPPSPSGPYFTRAKKAWCLAQFAGMSFPGSDDDAIRGLTEVIKENFPSMC